MSKSNNINRRRFLKKAAGAVGGAVAFPYIVSSSSLGKAGSVAPSNRVVMGCIGMGIQGTRNMQAFLKHKDAVVVAVCDVRESQRQKAKNIVDEQYGNNSCATYNDFRDLIARNDIDAVSIATPDHWHVLCALEAARNGKDMYLEKAMGLSVAADKALREAVNRSKVVFQFGTQQRSSHNFRFGCELVRNGRIGRLHTIMVGTPPGKGTPNQPTKPVPDDLDYDMWLGPARWAPYSYQRCRPFDENFSWSVWYHISDYCLGPVGGYWGVHHVDICQWGSGRDHTCPVEIEGTGLFPRDGLTDTATNWQVELLYSNGVKMIYLDNDSFTRHRLALPGHNQGVTFLGTEGWVFVRRGGVLETEPKSLVRSVIGADEIHLAASPGGHHRNFLDCVKTRRKTVCPIESSVRTDTACHLTDIAIRLKRKLFWDPEVEEFINDPEANRMLTRPMRGPWHL